VHRAHTQRDIDHVHDRLGIQKADAAAMRFEAAWSADGAACSGKCAWWRRALEALIRSRPRGLAGKVGAACSKETALGSGATLLLNASTPLC
jgi:hypothetical protein